MALDEVLLSREHNRKRTNSKHKFSDMILLMYFQQVSRSGPLQKNLKILLVPRNSEFREISNDYEMASFPLIKISPLHGIIWM